MTTLRLRPALARGRRPRAAADAWRRRRSPKRRCGRGARAATAAGVAAEVDREPPNGAGAGVAGRPIGRSWGCRRSRSRRPDRAHVAHRSTADTPGGIRPGELATPGHRVAQLGQDLAPISSSVPVSSTPRTLKMMCWAPASPSSPKWSTSWAGSRRARAAVAAEVDRLERAPLDLVERPPDPFAVLRAAPRTCGRSAGRRRRRSWRPRTGRRAEASSARRRRRS